MRGKDAPEQTGAGVLAYVKIVCEEHQSIAPLISLSKKRSKQSKARKPETPTV